MFREASAAMTPTSVISGKIVPLGDHLRADKDVDLPPVEGAEDPLRIALPGGGVAVHPDDPGIGEELPRLLLDPFRSGAVAADAVSLACRTDVGGLCREVAMMAFQGALGGMMGEGELAVRAGEGVAAVRAEEKGVEPPPVEKKEGLPSAALGFLGSPR